MNTIICQPNAILKFVLTSVYVVFSTTQLYAQHYPAGSEGIKGASLPSPGFYVRDDNSFYFYNKVPGFGGQLQNGFEQFSYTQTPRLLWVTPWKFLDLNFGAEVQIPLTYQEHTRRVPYGPPISSVPFPIYNTRVETESHFGLSDIRVEPLIIGWHLKHFDFAASYYFFAPSGNWDESNSLFYNLGKEYWSHGVSLGLTWYPDSEKTWAVSILNHYEINTSQYSSLVLVPISPEHPSGVAAMNTTLGDIYTLEWAISKTIIKGVDIAITGYYQQQVTSTEGPTFFGPTYQNEKIHVAGIGPEIKGEYAKWGLSGSLRFAYEFSAMDHPQGHLITLNLTKSF